MPSFHTGYMIKTIQEDANGDCYIDISEFVEELGWKEGDILEWLDNKDGTFTIRKKDATDSGRNS